MTGHLFRDPHHPEDARGQVDGAPAQPGTLAPAQAGAGGDQGAIPILDDGEEPVEQVRARDNQFVSVHAPRWEPDTLARIEPDEPAPGPGRQVHTSSRALQLVTLALAPSTVCGPGSRQW